MIHISLFVLLVCTLTSHLHGIPIGQDSLERSINPEEIGGDIQGDIKLPPRSMTRGVAMRGYDVRWPNGTVPYTISSAFNAADQNIILGAMRTLENSTAVNNVPCLQFREKTATDDYHYIMIVIGSGCSSYIGRLTGYTGINRTVTLQNPGCVYTGTIMHELIHALGFYHEQSRPDRDSYVRINYDTILSGFQNNFDKYDNTQVDTLNTPYDYGSLMHYGRDFFSKNGSDTLVPLDPTANIGQRNYLSPIDIEELRIFYGCIPPIVVTTDTSITTAGTIPTDATSATDNTITTDTISTTDISFTTDAISTTDTSFTTGNGITTDTTKASTISTSLATTVKTTSRSTDKSGGDNNGNNNGAIIGGVIGGVVIIGFLCGIGVIGFIVCFCCRNGSPVRSNKRFVNDGSRAQSNVDNNVFQAGSLAGYYFKDGTWHGPQDLALAFHPKANHTVHGQGVDNHGLFVASGVYSPQTLRMAFDKRYQTGTDGAGQNPSKQMTIQTQWNPNTRNFEGKYYFKGEKHREEQKYMIKLTNGADPR